MRIKCEFCDSFIDDTEEKCPYCGAVNKKLARSGSGIPKTIAELQDFAKAHNLPLQEMHYYLGEDYKGPKAIGIYRDKDTGNFVVYKNKSDGSRAVRYEGKDEAYAVNEIYQKMHTDVMNQKARNISQSAPSSYSSNKPSGPNFPFKKSLFCLLIGFFILFMLARGLGGCVPEVVQNSNGSGSNNSSYVRSYDYDYDTDSDSGSSWWNSDDDSSSSNDSWWSSDDSWDSSDWDWGSSDSWDSGSSDWDSDW